jgi:hypothetical protein
VLAFFYLNTTYHESVPSHSSHIHTHTLDFPLMTVPSFTPTFPLRHPPFSSRKYPCLRSLFRSPPSCSTYTALLPPETPVSIEKEYLCEITLRDTHRYLEFLVFKCHTPKEQIKIRLRIGFRHLIPQIMDQSMIRKLMLIRGNAPIGAAIH